MNKKTVKGILKLRPKLIEEICAQVCSGTQNLYWLKRKMYLHACRACQKQPFWIIPPKLCFHSRASNAVAL